MRRGRLAGIVRWLVLGLFVVAAGAAWAQAGGGIVNSPQQALQSAANPNGLAEGIMRGLLGGAFDNPFSVGGGASTIFGAMFLAFNMFVFAAAVAWATYGVAAGIVQTAHEGVVLGKRLSAIWMPIRLVTGVGSLIPVFGGFSLSQALMILALSWGISGANFVTNKAIEAFASFTPLTNPAVAKGNPAMGAYDLASALFFQELCRLGHEKHEREMSNAGASVAPDSLIRDFSSSFPDRVRRSAGDAVGIMIGTNANNAACMAVGIVRNKYEAPSGNEAWTFRNRTVNYNDINSRAYERYRSSFQSLSLSVKQLAAQYKAAVDSVNNGSGQQPEFPSKQLLSLSAQFVAASSPAAPTNEASTIQQGVIGQVKNLGFLSLGMYYSMLSEANTAMTAAQQAAEYVIQRNDGFSVTRDVFKNIEESMSSSSSRDFYVAAAMKAYKASSGAGSSSGTATEDLLGYDDPSGGKNFGQKILNYLLGALITGSGSPSSFNLIDPIISAKNIGDYLLSIGSTFLGAGAISSLLPGAAQSALSAAAETTLVGSVLAGLGKMAMALAWWMVIIGILLAIYIPFVPFMNWVAAMVQYVATVVQSFVAAPLWSFAHVAVDGEGMGQRAERGYLFLMLVLFKPVLMVIAFFAAAGMVMLIGSVVTWLFMPAVAHVQGNSVTGIASILAFISIYFILLNTIIQGSFNLVEEISDDVIGWIGNAGKSAIGRGMDERAGMVFIGGVKGTRGDVSAAMSGVGRKR